jgi:hypothetical protein
LQIKTNNRLIHLTQNYFSKNIKIINNIYNRLAFVEEYCVLFRVYFRNSFPEHLLRINVTGRDAAIMEI